MQPKYDYNSPGAPLTDDQRIPSESIEGYVKRFLMIQLESLAYGLSTPEKVRADLHGVSYFINCSAGLHTQIATSNAFYSLTALSDEQMIEVAKKTFKIKL